MMKKNENISISLQIHRDFESKGFFLSVQFNKNAQNFSIEDDIIIWNPTSDEIDFIADAFRLIGENKDKRKTSEDSTTTQPSADTPPMESPLHSSEIRIPPLTDDVVMDIMTGSQTGQQKKNATEEKIFVQADDKKIDEILRRRKPGISEEFIIDSEEKNIIDRMLKQKKKKE
jgi:hypothetical protein